MSCRAPEVPAAPGRLKDSRIPICPDGMGILLRNTRVLFKDLWYLAPEVPTAPGRVQSPAPRKDQYFSRA